MEKSRRRRNQFRQPIRCLPILLLCLCLFLEVQIQQVFAASAGGSGGGSTPPKPPKPPKPPTRNSSTDNTNTAITKASNKKIEQSANKIDQSSTSSSSSSTPKKPSSSLVEVYEHEFYDKQKLDWIGGDYVSSNTNKTDTSTGSSTNTKTYPAGRWSSSPHPSHRDAKAKYLPPPSELSPPRGYEYISDWKIDVTGKAKDELGWEYFIDRKEGLGRRRRRWLRTVSAIAIDEKKKTSSSTNSVGGKKTISNTGAGTTSSAVTTSSVTPKIPTITSKIPPIPPPRRVLSSTTRSAYKMKNLKPNATAKLLQELAESFNFKGYGINFYKSLLKKEACGIGVRLPITNNFAFLESRPYLPTVATAMIFTYPMKLSLLMNVSLPVELFQSAIFCILEWCIWVLTTGYCGTKTVFVDVLGHMILWNSLKALGKILAFGEQAKKDNGDDSDSDVEEEENMAVKEKKMADVEKKKKQSDEKDDKSGTRLVVLGRAYPTMPPRRAVTYHTGISDRLGLSLSANVSEAKGVEFKCSWWHAYLPTIDFLGSGVDQLVSVLMRKKQKIRKDATSEWLRQKFASLGLTWGGFFVPNHPFANCSAIMTLSGFYYGTDVLRRLCMQSVSGSSSIMETDIGASRTSRTNTILPDLERSTKSLDKSKAKLESRLRYDGIGELDETDLSSVESEMELIDVKVSAR
jgi:hypothetical protein